MKIRRSKRALVVFARILKTFRASSPFLNSFPQKNTREKHTSRTETTSPLFGAAVLIRESRCSSSCMCASSSPKLVFETHQQRLRTRTFRKRSFGFKMSPSPTKSSSRSSRRRCSSVQASIQACRKYERTKRTVSKTSVQCGRGEKMRAHHGD